MFPILIFRNFKILPKLAMYNWFCKLFGDILKLINTFPFQFHELFITLNSVQCHHIITRMRLIIPEPSFFPSLIRIGREGLWFSRNMWCGIIWEKAREKETLCMKRNTWKDWWSKILSWYRKRRFLLGNSVGIKFDFW